jgi:hypothetical protein
MMRLQVSQTASAVKVTDFRRNQARFMQLQHYAIYRPFPAQGAEHLWQSTADIRTLGPSPGRPPQSHIATALNLQGQLQTPPLTHQNCPSDRAQTIGAGDCQPEEND